jgi:hypothetical protein
LGSQSLVLIRRWQARGVAVRHRLPGVDPHVGRVSRRSNQSVKRPFSSDAAHGKNWSLPAGWPDESVERNAASDQCSPPSAEVWKEMSACEVGRLMLFW